FVPPVRSQPSSTLFPYTTLFRSQRRGMAHVAIGGLAQSLQEGARLGSYLQHPAPALAGVVDEPGLLGRGAGSDHIDPAVRKEMRSEEHTSELQSRENLVCRLLLE